MVMSNYGVVGGGGEGGKGWVGVAEDVSTSNSLVALHCPVTHGDPNK